MKIVTAAVILNNEKILIAQRAEGQSLAGKWEFPGGKIEEGETLEECLKREIKEELDVTIEVGKFIGESVYKYDFGEIKLLAYSSKWISGEFKLTVHTKIHWISIEEIDDYDFAPADLMIVEKLKNIKSKLL